MAKYSVKMGLGYFAVGTKLLKITLPCFICSMVLDHKLAVEVQDVKTEAVGQADSTMMLELLNFAKKFTGKQ